MISASRVGWGLAKISSEGKGGGKIFNIFIYISSIPHFIQQTLIVFR